VTTTSPGTGPQPSGFDDIRARGEGANGLIRVEVSGAGQVTELVVEPKAMRLPSAELSEAVRAALNAALSSAREQVMAAAKALPTPPELGRLTELVDGLGLLAQRRMDEFSTAAAELSARLDRA
jgi:DNA-binding protein YbaB